MTSPAVQEPRCRVDIGRARRALRSRQGLTQEALAALAGVSRSTVARAEDGAPIHETQVRALAQALAASPGAYLDPA